MFLGGASIPTTNSFDSEQAPNNLEVQETHQKDDEDREVWQFFVAHVCSRLGSLDDWMRSVQHKTDLEHADLPDQSLQRFVVIEWQKNSVDH